ncbi:MAG: hypothetical protein GX556_10620 [Fibrobacter sp.]|nr:hypothetical protein [Fibrobacter sp.]
MVSIVVVCTGNMCRSAMAEGILKKRLSDLGRKDILISSMGIHGQDGNRAVDEVVKACSDNEIDISAHRSRALVAGELKESDLIFVMEPVQKEFISIFFPQVVDRLFLLGCWPGAENKKGIIKDPIGGRKEDFRRSFRIIADHIERILPFLLARYPG